MNVLYEFPDLYTMIQYQFSLNATNYKIDGRIVEYKIDNSIVLTGYIVSKLQGKIMIDNISKSTSDSVFSF